MTWYTTRLRINSAGKTACAPNWSWSTAEHQWQDLDLWVVLDGEGYLDTSDASYPLRRGDAFLLRGGERYSGRQNTQRRLVVSHTHFDRFDDQGQRLASNDPSIPLFYRHVTNIVLFEQILAKMLGYWQAGHADSAHYWLGAALRCWQETETQSNPEQQILQQLRETIRTDPALIQSVAEMAARCHWHPDHFTHRFREHFDETPQHFLIQARLDRAKELLRYTDLQLQQIADTIGYESPAYFSRQFNKYIGCSPKAWRQQTI